MRSGAVSPLRLLLLSVVLACLVVTPTLAKKKKKGKKKKELTEQSDECVACRRMLGHLESHLADGFNKMDARILNDPGRESEFNNQLGPAAARKRIQMQRGPVVRDAMKACCAATGMMRPKLGKLCEKYLEAEEELFEQALIDHEQYSGRPGLAKYLCGKNVSNVCPPSSNWDNKGVSDNIQVDDPRFKSQPVPRIEDQPGTKTGIFKLVGKTVGDMVGDTSKDTIVFYRSRSEKSGAEMDRLYLHAWKEFGAIVKDTDLAKTLSLGEVELRKNMLPHGSPVGGEYIETATLAIYPADKPWAPVYILPHTDPAKAVLREGADWFWAWLSHHGKPATKLAVKDMMKKRHIITAAEQARMNQQALSANKQAKKAKRMPKPKHLVRRKNKGADGNFSVTIQQDDPIRNHGVRPTDYGRDSVLTPELICSACMVVIDEVEYKLRKLKDVPVTVGRRLGADGQGINKRLNPGRNEVNVADALEGACDLTNDYTASGTGKGQRWVRYNAHSNAEAILIEHAVVEAETPLKLVGACSEFLELHEDNLFTALLLGDPDSSIGEKFCLTQVKECNGATFDSSKEASKLWTPNETDFVPDVVKGESMESANSRRQEHYDFMAKLEKRKKRKEARLAREAAEQLTQDQAEVKARLKAAKAQAKANAAPEEVALDDSAGDKKEL